MVLTFENAVHCDECNNSGHRIVTKDGRRMLEECGCHAQRDSLIALKKSGMEDAISRFRFDNFVAKEHFQKRMLQLCRDFIAQQDSRFLYISGQTGTGKTHLGTAVCGHFIAGGRTTLYITFHQLMNEMKSAVNDEAYSHVLTRYGKAEALYIDDFMRTEPTAADIKHSFELINRRVVNGGITIFTSEKSIEEIVGYDEALGGRIMHMCGKFCFCIGYKAGRNYRLKQKREDV